MIQILIDFFNNISLKIWQSFFSFWHYWNAFSLYFPKNIEEVKTMQYVCDLNEKIKTSNTCQFVNSDSFGIVGLTIFLILLFGFISAIAIKIFIKSKKVRVLVSLVLFLLAFAFFNGAWLSLKYELRNIYYTDGYFVHMVNNIVKEQKDVDIDSEIEKFNKLSNTIYSKPYDFDIIANIRNQVLTVLIKSIYYNDKLKLQNEQANIKNIEDSFHIVKNEMKLVCVLYDNIFYDENCRKRMKSYIIQTKNDINFVKTYLNAKLNEMDKNYNIALEYYKQINENYWNYSLPIKKFISKKDLYITMSNIATQMGNKELVKTYSYVISFISNNNHKN